MRDDIASALQRLKSSVKLLDPVRDARQLILTHSLIRAMEEWLG